MADYRAFPATDGPSTTYSDGSAYTLGLEFYVTEAVDCTHIWFWVPTDGQVIGAECNLWQVDSVSTGTELLGGFELMSITGTGWISHALSTPVTLIANQRYRAVIHPWIDAATEESGLGRTAQYWDIGAGSAGIVNGPLVIPNAANATGQAQCSYGFAVDPMYPTQVNLAANYWIDVTVVDSAGQHEEYDVEAELRLGSTPVFPHYESESDVTATMQLDSAAEASYAIAIDVEPALQLESSATVILLPVAPLTLQSELQSVSYESAFDVVAPLRLLSDPDVSYASSFDVGAALTLRSSATYYAEGGGGGRGALETDLYYLEPEAPPTIRVIAQRILDKTFLDMDFPLSGLEVAHTLSGPALIKGVIEPELDAIGAMTPAEYLAEIGIEATATYLHVEEDGEIRASGILQPIQYNGEVATIEAAGVTSYPNGIPYLSTYIQQDVDPFDIVRAIWTHVEEQPGGAIHVSIDQHHSPVRIGNETKEVEEGVEEIVPYELVWYKTTDCGAEIDKLAKETPFDYAEWDRWNDDKTEILHTVRLGYPRLGRKRFDLRFATDENVADVVPYAEAAGQYVDTVIVLGAGEGSERVRGVASSRLGDRVRKVAVLEYKWVTDKDTAYSLAYEELNRRQSSIHAIDEIVVVARHENAMYGSYVPGDDILVGPVKIPHVGWVEQWHRITSYSYAPGTEELVRISLKPSASFNYGAGEATA